MQTGGDHGGDPAVRLQVQQGGAARHSQAVVAQLGCFQGSIHKLRHVETLTVVSRHGDTRLVTRYLNVPPGFNGQDQGIDWTDSESARLEQQKQQFSQSKQGGRGAARGGEKENPVRQHERHNARQRF